MRNTIFAVSATFLVATACVLGFLQTGSPLTARAQVFDDRRVDDLREIENALPYPDGHPKSLPSRLTNDDFQEHGIPKDPVTGRSYTYIRENATHYRLCAIFETSQTTEDQGAFAHHAGRQCFSGHT